MQIQCEKISLDKWKTPNRIQYLFFSSWLGRESNRLTPQRSGTTTVWPGCGAVGQKYNQGYLNLYIMAMVSYIHLFPCGIKKRLSSKSGSKADTQCCFTVQHFLMSFLLQMLLAFLSFPVQPDHSHVTGPPTAASDDPSTGCMCRLQRSRWCQRLVSVNMVCSFLTVLKPLTVSTNSSSSMNCKGRSGLRSEPVQNGPSIHFWGLSPSRCRGLMCLGPTRPRLPSTSRPSAGWRCVSGSSRWGPPAPPEGGRPRRAHIWPPTHPGQTGRTWTWMPYPHAQALFFVRTGFTSILMLKPLRVTLPAKPVVSGRVSNWGRGKVTKVVVKETRPDGELNRCAYQDRVAGRINSHGASHLHGQAHQWGSLSGVGGFIQDLQQTKHFQQSLLLDDAVFRSLTL